MEPNANTIFENTDIDGDRIEIITSRPDRLTVSVERNNHSPSATAYIYRDGAEALRDALTQWLGGSATAEERANEVAAPPVAPAATSFHRSKALELAVKMAPEGVTPSRLLDAADQMAHWIATGCRLPDTDPPTVVPRSMDFIDASPAEKTCPHCSHAFHGNVGCGEGGRGMHRCRCNGVLR